MKDFKGKIIYNPSGRAQEYSYWKDNFLKQAGIDRKDLHSNCVDRDYQF